MTRAAGGGSFDVDAPVAPSETVTRSAAVDEVTLGEGSGSGSGSGSTADVAKEHAGAVASDAKESTKNVASTAAAEAKDVAHEAKTQVRQLFSQLTGEASEQASGQTQRAVGGLRSLSSELSGMAQGQQGQQGQSGMASELARQGASRLDAAANWLEGRQPGEILEEVRSFARRRPGAFLAGAAVLGLVGGRMTRGLTGDSSSSGQSSTGSAAQGTASTASTYGVDTAYGHQPAGSPYAGDAAGAGYAADPLDLAGTDPNRVDAGIDPATYTHPGSSTGVLGESR